MIRAILVAGLVALMPMVAHAQTVAQGAAGKNPWAVQFLTAQPVTQSGTWNIGSITTLPNITIGAAIPAGANTIGAINLAQYTPVSGRLPVDGSGVTQPISHAALTELAAAIDTELQVDVVGALPAGDNNIGNVDVVTLPSVTVGTFPDNEPFNVAQINGVAPSMGNGASGTGVQRVTIANDSTGQINAIQSGTWNIGTVTTITGATITALPNEGQQTMANSISVAIASNQSAVAVDGSAVTQPVSNAGLTELAGAIDTEMQVDIVTLPSVTIGTFPDNEPFNIAQVGGTAVAVDAGPPSAGTQRIAVAAGDTATLSNVSGSASSVTCAAANAARVSLTIHNDSTATLFAKYGTTASATSYTWEVAPGLHLNIVGYSGRVDCIWSAATGDARVTVVE